MTSNATGVTVNVTITAAAAEVQDLSTAVQQAVAEGTLQQLLHQAGERCTLVFVLACLSAEPEPRQQECKESIALSSTEVRPLTKPSRLCLTALRSSKCIQLLSHAVVMQRL